MDRWEGKVAIVTGASVGIGAAIVKGLVEKGMKVVGIARRIDRIEELANNLDGPGKLWAAKCDVTREDEILKTFRWVTEHLGPVHVLINNAGITRPSTLTNGRTSEWRKVLEVNVIALCICTREAIKIMQAHGINGHIIHINSVLGHKVLPIKDMNVYPASKFAVTALTQSLQQELYNMESKIKISSISPGLVKAETQEQPIEDNQQCLDNVPYLRPEDVSDAVVYVLSTPPHLQVQDLIIQPL